MEWQNIWNENPIRTWRAKQMYKAGQFFRSVYKSCRQGLSVLGAQKNPSALTLEDTGHTPIPKKKIQKFFQGIKIFSSRQNLHRPQTWRIHVGPKVSSPENVWWKKRDKYICTTCPLKKTKHAWKCLYL